MRSIVLATIVAMTAFAGCLADPQSLSVETTTESPTASSTAPNSTATSSSAPATTPTSASEAPNVPPTASLSADVENGTAPLNVTFSIQGEDEDGDELMWTLDVDGDGEVDYNGTSAADAVTHQFTEAGNYTAVLNVTDGAAFANATVDVVVEAGEIAGPAMCHRPGATAAGPFYVVSEGGDWVFEESNGVPGLQVENNHPVGDPFWINPAWVDCANGDQMVN